MIIKLLQYKPLFAHTISQCDAIWTRKIPKSGLYYKRFTVVIYDHNDNGLYYKTTIVANLTTITANLALARRVNYIRKVCCKLKCTFTIANYDPKPFIVQATGNDIEQNCKYFKNLTLLNLNLNCRPQPEPNLSN
jgi:hypothetical protein